MRLKPTFLTLFTCPTHLIESTWKFFWGKFGFNKITIFIIRVVPGCQVLCGLNKAEAPPPLFQGTDLIRKQREAKGAHLPRNRTLMCNSMDCNVLYYLMYLLHCTPVICIVLLCTTSLSLECGVLTYFAKGVMHWTILKCNKLLRSVFSPWY